MVTQLWPRPRRDLSHRRWMVHYEDMALEGGGSSSWTGYHRTKIGALLAAWWNQHMATWGGVVYLERNRSVRTNHADGGL